jgi:hypothetical protein
MDTEAPSWFTALPAGRGVFARIGSSGFHPRLGLSGHENFQEPLYELLKTVTGADAERAHEEFEAIAADQEMARRCW